MNTEIQLLIEAEKKAALLFDRILEKGLLQPGKTEKEINQDIFNLASSEFGIQKYWHKRIIRAGKNTLLPYQENPPELILKENDILFLDFGPVFEDWEADYGRTFVIGNDPQKIKLAQDVEKAWWEGKTFWEKYKDTITGAEFYEYTSELASKFGWKFGNEHCGHLVGKFPHEKLIGEEKINYIHPSNHTPMSNPDRHGHKRYWIYEIHFINEELQIGGFFEQLMC